MAPIVEFEGKTVEGAVKEASEKLNIPTRKLKHDVISYGSSGIFGLVGAKRAKIRVSVAESAMPKAQEEPIEKVPSESEEVVSLVEEAFGETLSDTEDAAAVEQLGREALQTMIDTITPDTAIETDRKGETLFFNITGGNSAILIGKRGQTLEAMQYLVEKIVNKQSEGRVRVEIDVEGYLEKKKEKLVSLALRLGEKVKQTQKPAMVGQLNGYDRRIVHLALKADSEVRTHSIGEGYIRKLKIFPKQRRRGGESSKTENK
jgi:spoIIIJ-associated protein